jgi:hypothetical protein
VISAAISRLIENYTLSIQKAEEKEWVKFNVVTIILGGISVLSVTLL